MLACLQRINTEVCDLITMLWEIWKSPGSGDLPHLEDCRVHTELQPACSHTAPCECHDALERTLRETHRVQRDWKRALPWDCERKQGGRPSSVLSALCVLV